ncbi:MAG: hypothetical protein CVV24_12645 [Ignavibacteriae bacterium HGW-Ignavibacteriae-3]|nr:MAG: hypothetical protein CVV24_12645 [Ignavibacteriae bacterium HGW-Ignavibacteriae-3]
MKKIVTIISLFFLFASIMPAQTDLSFEFDYARFKYDASSGYIEFYYELNPKNMQRTATDKGPLVEAIVHLELKNMSTNEQAINKDWRIQHIVSEDESDSLIQSVGDVMGFLVPAGKYSLVMTAKDSKNPLLAKTINETVLIELINSDTFYISDVEIARSIKMDGVDKSSVFYKNSMEIIPNPSMFYTPQHPALFYYAELYNLKLDEGKDFSLKKNLLNSSGTPVYRADKIIKQSSNAVVEYGVVNMSKFPTDSYTLELSLIDPSTNKAFVSTKRFYLYNPNAVELNKSTNINASVLGSEFGLYSLEECNTMFAQAKYIASQSEVDQFSRLDSLNAKREFLFNFWRVRDDVPATPKNEFKEEYMKRVALANQKFTRMNREGYLTDQGRVLLLYGEPDQKDYYPSESNMKPYEVWFYNQLEGGANFIFGDISGFGKYELVHSTKRGELQDANWQRRLRSTVQ